MSRGKVSGQILGKCGNVCLMIGGQLCPESAICYQTCCVSILGRSENSRFPLLISGYRDGCCLIEKDTDSFKKIFVLSETNFLSVVSRLRCEGIAPRLRENSNTMTNEFPLQSKSQSVKRY